MNYVPYHMSAAYPDGSFDIPKHSIDAFLRLSESSSMLLGRNIFTWLCHLNNVSDLLYLDHLENTFPVHRSFQHLQYTEGAEAIMLRQALLTELAEQGFTLQVKPADRIEVTLVDAQYVYEEYSIGRRNQWCWINQNNTRAFRQGEEQDLMNHIVSRLEYFHNYKVMI